MEGYPVVICAPCTKRDYNIDVNEANIWLLPAAFDRECFMCGLKYRNEEPDQRSGWTVFKHTDKNGTVTGRELCFFCTTELHEASTPDE